MAVIAIVTTALLFWFASIFLRVERDKRVRKYMRRTANMSEATHAESEQRALFDEQTTKLEQRVELASEEIDFQYAQIDRLRQHIERNYTERDACVYGSSEYFKWDKKCLTLERQLHTAENKLANAEFTMAQAKAKLGVA